MATNSPGTTARTLYTNQTHYLRETVTYNGPGTVPLGFLPAGATVVSSGAAVQTAFNAATTNTIAIGINGDINDYGSALDVSAQGVKGGDLSSSNNAVLTADTEVFATLAMTGTAATAGSAEVFVEYLI